MANRKKGRRNSRDNGLRNRVSHQFSELTSRVNGGKKKRRGPKPVRDAVDRLEATVTQLRRSSGRRPARTR